MPDLRHHDEADERARTPGVGVQPRRGEGALRGGVAKARARRRDAGRRVAARRDLGYTLCEKCNNLTGAYYGEEYKWWALAIVNALAEAGVNTKQIDALDYIPDGPLRLMDKKGRGVRPGAFVRQALSIMCTLSANFDLAGRYPVIREIIVDRRAAALPDGMSIGLTGYIGGYPRVIGPQIVVRPAEGSWHCLMELAVPPLALLMILGGNAPFRHVFDLTPFAQAAPNERHPVEARLALAIGYTMYPGDYRTKTMIERQAAENDKAAATAAEGAR